MIKTGENNIYDMMNCIGWIYPPPLKMQSSRHHQDDMKHFYVFETVEPKLVGGFNPL